MKNVFWGALILIGTGCHPPPSAPSCAIDPSLPVHTLRLPLHERSNGLYPARLVSTPPMSEEAFEKWITAQSPEAFIIALPQNEYPPSPQRTQQLVANLLCRYTIDPHDVRMGVEEQRNGDALKKSPSSP